MSFNLKRVTASLVATTMAVQTLATPVLAAGTQSTVAKTGAAAQSTAATVQTSTGKAPVTFTNSANLVKSAIASMSQNATANLVVPETPAEKVQASIEKKTGMDYAAFKNTLMEGIRAARNEGRLDTAGYGLTKAELSAAVEDTLRTYYLTESVTNVAYEVENSVATAATFTVTPVMISAMDEIETGNNIAAYDDILVEAANELAQSNMEEDADSFNATEHTHSEDKFDFFWKDESSDCEHTYSDTPKDYWTKGEDGSWTYTAVYYCSNSDYYEIREAKDESTGLTCERIAAEPGLKGKDTYTATVTGPNGKEHTATKIINYDAEACNRHTLPTKEDGTIDTDQVTVDWALVPEVVYTQTEDGKQNPYTLGFDSETGDPALVINFDYTYKVTKFEFTCPVCGETMTLQASYPTEADYGAYFYAVQNGQEVAYPAASGDAEALEGFTTSKTLDIADVYPYDMNNYGSEVMVFAYGDDTYLAESHDKNTNGLFQAEKNLTETLVYMYYDQMVDFNRKNTDSFGISSPYWTSKNSDNSPFGAVRNMCSIAEDQLVPYANMMVMVHDLPQAFIAYVYYYEDLLLNMRDQAMAVVDSLGDNATTVQKLLVLHDWLGQQAEFDMGSMSDVTEQASADPIQMTVFGTLLTEQLNSEESVYHGAVCLGYAAAYNYLVQNAFPEIYKNEDGSWKTPEELEEAGNNIVDFGQIMYFCDTAETSVAGEAFGGGYFNNVHYFNCVRTNESGEDNWYYVDACYDDIYVVCMDQTRAESDGNLVHNYFLMSPKDFAEEYDGYYDYIDTLYDGTTYVKTDEPWTDEDTGEKAYIEKKDTLSTQYDRENVQTVTVQGTTFGVDKYDQYLMLDTDETSDTAYTPIVMDLENGGVAIDPEKFVGTPQYDKDGNIVCIISQYLVAHHKWESQNKDDEKTYSDDSFSDTWFSSAIGPVYFDGDYWYYADSETNPNLNSQMSDMGDQMDNMGDMGDSYGDMDISTAFSDAEKPDTLHARPRTAPDLYEDMSDGAEQDLSSVMGSEDIDLDKLLDTSKKPDIYGYTLVDFSDGTVYQFGTKGYTLNGSPITPDTKPTENDKDNVAETDGTPITGTTAEIIKNLLPIDEVMNEIYPGMTHSMALDTAGNKLYFNLYNTIFSYDLTEGNALNEVKVYNDVFYAQNQAPVMEAVLDEEGNQVVDGWGNPVTQVKKDANGNVVTEDDTRFVANSFYTVDSKDAAHYKGTVSNHPIASLSIRDYTTAYQNGTDPNSGKPTFDGPETKTVLRVSIATNLSNTYLSDGTIGVQGDDTGKAYELEAYNYNPNSRRMMTNDDDQNDNKEFMWCAVIVDQMSMDNVRKASGDATEKTYPATCFEAAYTQSRTKDGLCTGTRTYADQQVEANQPNGHTYELTDTEIGIGSDGKQVYLDKDCLATTDTEHVITLGSLTAAQENDVAALSEEESEEETPETITVTITKGTGTDEVTAAMKGERINLTANVPEGQEFTGFLVTTTVEDGEESDDIDFVTTNEEGTTAYFLMPDCDVTVTPTYQSYNITVDEKTKDGTVKADKTTAAVNETVTLTITPDENYALDELIVSKVAAEGAEEQETVPVTVDGDKATFTMPASDVTISATFKRIYAITVEQPEKGKVEADKKTAAEGETVTLKVEEGYVLDNLEVTYSTTVEGKPDDNPDNPVENVKIAEDKASATFTMPAGDVRVKATIEEKTAILKIENGEGGTITLSVNDAPVDIEGDNGNVIVVGAEVVVTVTAEVGYIASLKVDGVEDKNPDDNIVAFEMPNKDVTIKVTYEETATPESASRAGEAHGAPAKESELTCLVAVTCNVCGHTFFVTDPEIKHENGQYTAVYHDHSSIYGARPESAPMYRLYNPNSGEHFFTADAEEKDHLVDVGWDDEGIAWYAPVGVGDPVYRLYNRYGGEHHYTIDEAERDMLIEAGWNDEGVGWYTYGTEVPIYRVYNPNEYANNHHYTADKDEIDTLLAIPAANPWRDEGICWYGMAQ